MVELRRFKCSFKLQEKIVHQLTALLTEETTFMYAMEISEFMEIFHVQNSRYFGPETFGGGVFVRGGGGECNLPASLIKQFCYLCRSKVKFIKSTTHPRVSIKSLFLFVSLIVKSDM